MENQNQLPASQEEQPKSPTIPPTPLRDTNAPNVNKPNLEVPDQVAQALLTINGAEAGHKHGTGPSLGIMISLGILVVLVILASVALGGFKSGGSTKSPAASNVKASGQSATNATGGASRQINQDVNTCANAEDAIADC
jgi:hypothetical protein